MNYSTPIIEILEIEAEDVILNSLIQGGVGDNETEIVSVGGGSIGGTTGGKITIVGGTTGGVSAGDLFGNR